MISVTVGMRFIILDRGSFQAEDLDAIIYTQI